MKPAVQLARIPVIEPVQPKRPLLPSLGPVQDALLANVAFVFERGIYLPVRMAMRPEPPHKLSSELKPSCVRIAPITKLAIGTPSTRADLIQWCNNLAIHVGVHNPGPRGFIYHCTEDNFGK